MGGPGVARFVRDPDAPILTILVVIAALAGLWLGLTATHRSVLARVGIWTSLLGSLALIVTAMVVLTRPWRTASPAVVEDHPMFLVGGFALAVGSGLIVALAEFPAWIGRFLGRTTGSALFRWRRERARRRRSGQ
jgi:hypothetical protein